MNALKKLDLDQQQVVRSEVRALLERTPAFADLGPERKGEIANALVRVVAFLADPKAGQEDVGDGGTPVAALAIAEAAADDNKRVSEKGVGKLADRLGEKQDFAGKDFKAGAMEAGTKAFKELVKAVDFPKFVAGLIDGVFNSIVTASIRQMDAYGKLLKSVVQSADQFATENISQNNARDWLVDRFPSSLQIQMGAGGPKLAPKGDDPNLNEITTTLGMKQSVDFDDAASEGELVRQARLEMARMRQQQLATMVLLGINRIVVTDGVINARVLFDVQASDDAKRRAKASMHDDKQDSVVAAGGGWGSDEWTATSTHNTTVSSAVDDTSESKAKLKANLAGEVRVNFKSETVSLDKIANNVQIAALNEKSSATTPAPPAQKP